MALGDQISESTGRITGIRVIAPVVGGPAQMEGTFQRSGTLLGQKMTVVGTYVQSVRSRGVLYAEGDLILLTQDGESVQWSGFSIGKPTGALPAGHFAVCGTLPDRLSGIKPPRRGCKRGRVRLRRGGQLPLDCVGVEMTHCSWGR